MASHKAEKAAGRKTRRGHGSAGKTMRKDAIYARQSVEKKDSVSIDGQIELCRRECSGDPAVFTDSGFSGKNTDRPAFQKLMRAVQNGDVGRIIVYRLDRISRSIADFGDIWDTLKQHGVEFVSVNEKFDTSTPVGRAMVYIIMVFAQLERETIAERIRDNYRQRAKRGAYLGGPAPFGFSIARTVIDGKAASMLVPNGDIKTLKTIFSRYANQDISLGELASGLLQDGIGGINRSGWDNVALSRILHNPVYVKADADVYFFYRQKGVCMDNELEEFTGEKGCWLFGKRDRGENKYSHLNEHLLALARHDGVIDSSTWLRCQARLEQNRQLKNTGKGSYSWLTGFVKCGYCGYAMRVVNDSASTGRAPYFSCTGKSNLKICGAKDSPPVATIEGYVAEEIARRLKEFTHCAAQSAEPEGAERNLLKIELSKTERQISNLIDSLAEANGVAARYVNDRLSVLDAQKSETLRKIAELSAPRGEIPFPDVDFAGLSFADKKKVARALIQKVSLFHDEIQIQWEKL